MAKYEPAAYMEKYFFTHNKVVGQPAYEWPPDGEDHALYVFVTNKRGEHILSCYPDLSTSERFVGAVEGDGCLTIYREWSNSVCDGRKAVASYAPGSWSRWEKI